MTAPILQAVGTFARLIGYALSSVVRVLQGDETAVGVGRVGLDGDVVRLGQEVLGNVEGQAVSVVDLKERMSE